jgi:redox-sensitive bicupin YhaK (pirin superfamily)
VIGEGDVQWMTAASGILHKEFHEENFSKEGGDFQMVQLWVNLPAKDKMSAPKYQDIKNADMPKVSLDHAGGGDGGFVEVVAGDYQGATGAASTFTPVTILNARMRKGDNAAFRFPAEHNTALLVVEGHVTVNGADMVPTDHFGLFENAGEDFTVTAEDDAVVLVLSGQPIDEPIAAHGPFVMNSRAELVQAFEDYNNGKFGYLT